MNLLHDAPLWARLLLVALLLAAAAQDVVQRRISNLLCLAVIVLAIAAALVVGLRAEVWQNGLVFALLLALGMPAFAAGWLGGGDVKLLAALGLWVDLSVVLPLLACVFIAGGVLAIVSLAVRPGQRKRSAKGVPYGVAIAIGAAIVLVQPSLTQGRGAQAPLDLKAARQAMARS